MTEPYSTAVRVLPPDAAPDPEHTGPIVIEVIIRVQQDGATVPSAPVARPPLPAVLTRREQEVMNLLVQRYSNRMIAEALVITESTVKHHMRRILAKLGVSNRFEAIEAVGRPLLLERNA